MKHLSKRVAMRTEQIVAKALEQVDNDRYVLANMIFKRVRQLNNGAPNLVGADVKLEKLADIAMREIAEGKLVLEGIEERKRAL